MKYASDRFISKLDTAEERITDLVDRTTETSTTEKQKENKD